MTAQQRLPHRDADYRTPAAHIQTVTMYRWTCPVCNRSGVRSTDSAAFAELNLHVQTQIMAETWNDEVAKEYGDHNNQPNEGH